MDANEPRERKGRRKLLKNAMRCLEQILDAIPNKTETVRPLASYLKLSK